MGLGQPSCEPGSPLTATSRGGALDASTRCKLPGGQLSRLTGQTCLVGDGAQVTCGLSCVLLAREGFALRCVFGCPLFQIRERTHNSHNSASSVSCELWGCDLRPVCCHEVSMWLSGTHAAS